MMRCLFALVDGTGNHQAYRKRARRCVLAVAVGCTFVITAWLFRFETLDGYGNRHRNRLTGVTCLLMEECWFHSVAD